MMPSDEVLRAVLGADATTEVERERKYRLRPGERRRIAEALESEGTWLRASTEADVLFDHPMLELERHDSALRLRTWEPGGRFELTYKGPREYRRGDRVREELTTAVDAAAPRLLRALGFVATRRIVKLREVRRAYGCEISLDQVDGVGDFCEIEAQSDGVDLEAVAGRLGLDEGALEPRTYAELVEDAVV